MAFRKNLMAIVALGAGAVNLAGCTSQNLREDQYATPSNTLNVGGRMNVSNSPAYSNSAARLHQNISGENPEQTQPYFVFTAIGLQSKVEGKETPASHTLPVKLIPRNQTTENLLTREVAPIKGAEEYALVNVVPEQLLDPRTGRETTTWKINCSPDLVSSRVVYSSLPLSQYSTTRIQAGVAEKTLIPSQQMKVPQIMINGVPHYMIPSNNSQIQGSKDEILMRADAVEAPILDNSRGLILFTLEGPAYAPVKATFTQKPILIPATKPVELQYRVLEAVPLNSIPSTQPSTQPVK